jgi:hypothetical protein
MVIQSLLRQLDQIGNKHNEIVELRDESKHVHKERCSFSLQSKCNI